MVGFKDTKADREMNWLHIESRISLAILKKHFSFMLLCTGILVGYSSDVKTTTITQQ